MVAGKIVPTYRNMIAKRMMRTTIKPITELTGQTVSRCSGQMYYRLCVSPKKSIVSRQIDGIAM